MKAVALLALWWLIAMFAVHVVPHVHVRVWWQ